MSLRRLFFSWQEMARHESELLKDVHALMRSHAHADFALRDRFTRRAVAMARLIVKADESTDPIDLSVGTTVHIGRDPANEVALPDARGASRKHCRLDAVQAGGAVQWELTDLGATNKTRVNGKPADKCVLSSGDGDEDDGVVD